MNGCLRLKAERVGQRTAVTDAFRTAPFHVGQPSDRNNDGGVDVVVQEIGPGLLPGDATEIAIEVGPGARLTVRGQAATRLYPCPPGIGVVAATRLRVAAAGSLVYLPGELIPFRDAELNQRAAVEVEAGGRLALGEIVTPGRLAMGECDAYRTLTSRLDVRVDGRLVLAERTRLDPSRRPLGMPGRRGRWPCLGTLWLVGFGGAATDLGQSQRGEDDAVWWGSGGDDVVAMVRLAGMTAQGIRDVQQRLLGRLPWQ